MSLRAPTGEAISCFVCRNNMKKLFEDFRELLEDLFEEVIEKLKQDGKLVD
jgi:hypothetical protein